MSVDREMTLKEWCARLPSIHLVNKELADLEAQLAEKQAKIEELEGTIQSAYRLIIEHHNASKPVQAGCFCPHCTKDGEETPAFAEIARQAQQRSIEWIYHKP